MSRVKWQGMQWNILSFHAQCIFPIAYNWFLLHCKHSHKNDQVEDPTVKNTMEVCDRSRTYVPKLICHQHTIPRAPFSPFVHLALWDALLKAAFEAVHHPRQAGWLPSPSLVSPTHIHRVRRRDTGIMRLYQGSGLLWTDLYKDRLHLSTMFLRPKQSMPEHSQICIHN